MKKENQNHKEDNRKYIQYPFYLMAYDIKNDKNLYKIISDETLLERTSEMYIGISIY